MLKMTDLTVSKELESKEMSEVRGGIAPFAFLASTSIYNSVADVDQVYSIGLAQGNKGAVTNIQAINGGNGTSSTPVSQDQSQHNSMWLSGIGNVAVV